MHSHSFMCLRKALFAPCVLLVYYIIAGFQKGEIKHDLAGLQCSYHIKLLKAFGEGGITMLKEPIYTLLSFLVARLPPVSLFHSSWWSLPSSIARAWWWWSARVVLLQLPSTILLPNLIKCPPSGKIMQPIIITILYYYARYEAYEFTRTWVQLELSRVHTPCAQHWRPLPN